MAVILLVVVVAAKLVLPLATVVPTAVNEERKNKGCNMRRRSCRRKKYFRELLGPWVSGTGGPVCSTVERRTDVMYEGLIVYTLCATHIHLLVLNGVF